MIFHLKTVALCAEYLIQKYSTQAFQYAFQTLHTEKKIIHFCKHALSTSVSNHRSVVFVICNAFTIENTALLLELGKPF